MTRVFLIIVYCLAFGNAAATQPQDDRGQSQEGAYAHIYVSDSRHKAYQRELADAENTGWSVYNDIHMGQLEATARADLQKAKTSELSAPTPAYSQYSALLCAGVVVALDEVYSRDTVADDARLLIRHAITYAGYKIKANAQAKRARAAGNIKFANELEFEAESLLTRNELYASHIIHFNLLKENVLPARGKEGSAALGAYCDGEVEAVREYLRANNTKYD